MKAGKRARGSVFQRKQDGRWVVQVALPEGKRLVRYATSKAEAEEKLAVLLVQQQQGEAVPVSELTLERWLEEYTRRHNVGRAQSTINDRKYMVRHICAGGMGKVRLDKLTPARVQQWADGLTYSHRTNSKALQLLRSALNEAMALGHVSRNVALPVTLQRQPAKKAGTSWTQQEAQAFLAANEGTGHYLLWRLGLQTGMRIGELLALRVEHYDATTGVLMVRGTVSASAGRAVRKAVNKPKTASSVRDVYLPPDAQETVRQMLARRERLSGGAGWRDEGWLFPSEVGTIIPYDNARRAWKAALGRADVPPIRTHDMRVTFISLALRRGVKPEVVARIVGHASPLITLRIYRQVFDEELTEAAAAIQGIV